MTTLSQLHYNFVDCIIMVIRTIILKYMHPEKVFCFFLITSVKLKGTCRETYHIIAKVDPVLLVKFGWVW